MPTKEIPNLVTPTTLTVNSKRNIKETKYRHNITNKIVNIHIKVK